MTYPADDRAAARQEDRERAREGYGEAGPRPDFFLLECGKRGPQGQKARMGMGKMGTRQIRTGVGSLETTLPHRCGAPRGRTGRDNI